MIKYKSSRWIPVMAVLLGLGIASCNKKLDINPQNSVPAEIAMKTADDLEAAVTGLYAKLDDPSLYGTDLNLDAELLGGFEYVRWTGTFNAFRDIYRKTNLNAQNSRVTGTWVEAYANINLANIVLANLNLTADASQRTQLEGQALFIRGIMLFELVRFFGLPWDPGAANNQLGVVIKTVPTTDPTTIGGKPARNTVAEVYTQVIKDLQSAIAKLSPTHRTRATKYTAEAFLARVYLQQARYADALPLANDIILNSGKKLTPTPDGAFTNKNSTETLLEIQQNDQNNAGASNDGLSTFYADSNNIGRGGDVDIEPEFADLYDPADMRRTAMIYNGWTDGALHTAKWYDPGQNIPVIRLAEILLIRAECNFRLVSAVGATPLADVNEVHTRASLPAFTAVTLDDILLERRLELAFEGLRIHDIKRLKQSTKGGPRMDVDLPWNSGQLVFPIPEREIKANSNLQQNPGY